MSVHMRTHHTKQHKVSKPILCISEQGDLCRIPRSILIKYVVNDESSYKKAKKIMRETLGVTPEEAFAEINDKYTKTGALLKAVRLREGMNQKEFSSILDVTQGDLSKMERGERPIGKILVARIAKRFGSKIK